MTHPNLLASCSSRNGRAASCTGLMGPRSMSVPRHAEDADLSEEAGFKSGSLYYPEIAFNPGVIGSPEAEPPRLSLPLGKSRKGTLFRKGAARRATASNTLFSYGHENHLAKTHWNERGLCVSYESWKRAPANNCSKGCHTSGAPTPGVSDSGLRCSMCFAGRSLIWGFLLSGPRKSLHLGFVVVQHWLKLASFWLGTAWVF